MSGLLIIASALGVVSGVLAQPAARPLDVQGLDQFSVAGIRSRAMGGTNIANARDASALFSNPAGLAPTALELHVGGLFGTTQREQMQEWVPMRPVPGLSVLFEGLTGSIKKPDSLGIAGLPLSAWSSLQKQYDNLTPNWKRNSSGTRPLSLSAAMPLEVGGMNAAFGLGLSQEINVDDYYQNNNSMTPYLGQERPDPGLITARNDTLHVRWYQYTRTREGAVYGITPGFSIAVLPGLRVGASAAFLTGSSDDNERRVERGRVDISIVNGVGSNFMVDSVYYVQSKTGTSKYSGTMLTFGLHFQQERYALGVSIRPSMQVVRTWDRTISSVDTSKNPYPVRVDSLRSRTYQESGTDHLNFPFSYALGIVLKPTDKWIIAFDYELRHLADAELTTGTGGSASHPWANSKGAMRLGAEYRPNDMLALRGGYREDVQAFSPDGSAIIDEPARGGVYSLGAGVGLGSIFLDVAYEYSILKYQDIYQSNVNYNTRAQHQFMMEVAYRF
jgi:opacity protein-like surface antigen